MGFGLAVQAMFIFPVRFFAIEGLLQAPSLNALRHVGDRHRIHIEGRANGFHGPMGSAFITIGFEQDPGSTQFSRRSRATGNEFFKVRAFCFG
jgi:hypothetical protein